MLKVAPYRPEQQVKESPGKGIRVLGVAFAPSRWVSYTRVILWLIALVLLLTILQRILNNMSNFHLFLVEENNILHMQHFHVTNVHFVHVVATGIHQCSVLSSMTRER